MFFYYIYSLYLNLLFATQITNGTFSCQLQSNFCIIVYGAFLHGHLEQQIYVACVGALWLHMDLVGHKLL